MFKRDKGFEMHVVFRLDYKQYKKSYCSHLGCARVCEHVPAHQCYHHAALKFFKCLYYDNHQKAFIFRTWVPGKVFCDSIRFHPWDRARVKILDTVKCYYYAVLKFF